MFPDGWLPEQKRPGAILPWVRRFVSGRSQRIHLILKGPGGAQRGSRPRSQRFSALGPSRLLGDNRAEHLRTPVDLRAQEHADEDCKSHWLSVYRYCLTSEGSLASPRRMVQQ